MKRLLLLAVCLACCGGKTDPDGDTPESPLDSGSSSSNVEIGTVSVKYLTQNAYNDGDFTEDKLVAEPSFSREEPYCYTP